MKAATVEICFHGGDFKFRCPECDSLNINGETTASKCPDCGAEFVIPDIVPCDCVKEDEQLPESICEDGSIARDYRTIDKYGG
ncbi:MAG: hypothetical protein PHQ43_13250 [Dehalococcoidales bacterium]|nr:hypothetical protein [Dehalococcoidales bacterium]